MRVFVAKDCNEATDLVERVSRLCSHVTHKRLASILSVVAAVLVVGCSALWIPPSDQPPPSTPILDFQKITTPNLEPALSGDSTAYRVGAWWRYRDATADHRPTYHPGPNLLMEILGTVVASDGTEIYVLYQEEPDGTEGLHYVHRDPRGVLEHARGESGSPMVLSNPARVIDLPFVEEKQWTYRIGEQTYEAECFFPETLWLRSGIYFDCWKIGLRNVTTEETEYYWFKNGIGLLKIVRHSLSYELIAASTTGTSTIHRLGWEDRDGTIKITVGDRVVVQLPAEENSGYEWTLTANNQEIVSPLNNGLFLADLGQSNGGPSAVTGTFVAQFEALASTPAGEPMKMELQYVPLGNTTEPAYTFTFWLVVSH